MQTLLHILQHAFTKAIAKAFPELSSQDAQADLAPCQQEEFGHYQCNSALRLSKLLKKNPREIAQRILEALDSTTKQACSRLDIAGPGFLNVFLSPPFLSAQVQAVFLDSLLGAEPPIGHKKVIVEFSSPNIAKELHVGHIRSTIIGDCLARLFEFLGFEVLRLNHIGDWGTQFGMLITYMLEHAPRVLKGEEKTDLHALMGWYRAAKKIFDQDAEFKKRSQLEVVKLQSGNPEAMHAWKIICDVSRKGFEEIYHLLNVKILERGESFYNPFLKDVVNELEQKGLVTTSNGAKCIFMEGFTGREGEPLPMIIQKSDGGYNYDTTDLAAMRYRVFQDKADRIVVVTDVGQCLHFQMLIKASQLAGWVNPEKVQVDHVGFGLVLGLDGKKFKTRAGDTEKLIDLLTEAVDHARNMIIERLPTANQAEIDHLAHVLGIGAVKYADLSSHRTKDYTFSYERMLRFEGNTAVFLLYAYVRIVGIKRKTQANMEQVLATHQIRL